MDFDLNIGHFNIQKTKKSNSNVNNPVINNIAKNERNEEVLSKTANNALINNFVGQNRVNFKGSMNDEKTLREEILKEAESYKDGYASYKEEYLPSLKRYMNSLTKKEDLDELYKFVKTTTYLIKNEQLDSIDLTDSNFYKKNEPQRYIKSFNVIAKKTLEVNKKHDFYHQFEKLYNSEKPEEETDLWLKILDIANENNVDSNYVSEIHSVENYEHFKKVNPESVNEVLKLLKQTDGELLITGNKFLELSPEQIKKGERYLIKDEYDSYIYDTDDLYWLCKIEDDKTEKIKPYIGLSNGPLDKVGGETLYKIANCDEKLYKAIRCITDNGRFDDNMRHNDNVPIYCSFDLKGWVNISSDNIKKIDEKLIENNEYEKLRMVLNILSSDCKDNVKDFMLKNNIFLSKDSLEKLNLDNETTERLTKSQFVSIVIKNYKNKKADIIKNLKELSQEDLNKLDENLDNKIISNFISGKVNEFPDFGDSLFPSPDKISDKEKPFKELINNLIEEKTIVEQFALEEGYSPFFESAKNINCDEILYLSKYVLNNLDKNDKEKIADLSKELKILINEKDPKGQQLFIDLKSDDNSEKREFFGALNILDAKVNNPQKYKQLKTVIGLIKQGKLPRHIVSVMSVNGELTDLVNDDLNKILSNKPIIETFSDNETAFLKTKKGDVAEVGNKLFANNGQNLEEIKMDKKTYLKLFPPVERFGFSQGQTGDCYLVSALYDMMKNPDTRIMLYKMFEQSGNDIKITFPDKNIAPIIFKDFNTRIDTDEHISSALGIQMLESAYKEMLINTYNLENEMSTIEGGAHILVFNRFLNGNSDSLAYMFLDKNDYIKYQKKFDKMEEDYQKDLQEAISDKKRIDEMKKNNVSSVLISDWIKEATLGTPDSRIRCLKEMKLVLDKMHFVPESDKIRFLIEQSKDPNVILSCGTKNNKETEGIKEKLIAPCHAYSIKSVNEKEGTVEVVNPWNCAQSIKLTFEEFDKNYSMITVTKIKECI